MIAKCAFALTTLAAIVIATTIYVSQPQEDPVFQQTLQEANGDVVAAIKLMGYATCDENGDLVYVALNRWLPQNRRAPLRMNNGVLRQLKQFDTIKTLIITNVNDMDDDGMACIAELKNLELLNIRLVSITGKGLEHLKALNKLQILFIDRTRLTDEEIRDFRDALPGCDVRFNGRW